MASSLSEPLQTHAETSSAANLTGGRVLAKSTAWNLGGQVLPVFAAALCIPPLVRNLGPERFGVLTIAWIVTGYFSFFDFGLGRALTNMVARYLGKNEHDGLPALIWTGNVVMLLFGVAGAGLLSLFSPLLVRLLNIPASLQRETLWSFQAMALSLPAVISSTGLRGVLEAWQKFGVVNVIKTPLGIATFALPVAVLPFSHSLVPITIALTVARYVFAAAYGIAVFRFLPSIRTAGRFERGLLPELFRFGGWMTVSNLISPMMVYMDRFFIGSLLTMTAVTYYVTPYEVATKLVLIPAAIVGVLFPAFSTSLVANPQHGTVLFNRAVKYVCLIVFPIVFLFIVYAKAGLQLWLGADFAANSSRVLQCISVGVLVNCIAFVPAGLVQGAGRPDLSAKIHMCELPIYVVSVWFMTTRWGVMGTALAWTIRVTLDCIFLMWAASLSVKVGKEVAKQVAGPLIGVTAAFLIDAYTPSLTARVMMSAMIALVFAAVAWFYLLEAPERLLFRSRLLKVQPVAKVAAAAQ